MSQAGSEEIVLTGDWAIHFADSGTPGVSLTSSPNSGSGGQGNTAQANFDGIASLKAAPGGSHDSAQIPGRPRYQWKTGDFTAQSAVDTAEGVYIKANDTPVSVGMWVLDFDQTNFEASWFGVLADGASNEATATDDTAAWQTAINVVQMFGGGSLHWDGRSKVSDTLLVTGNHVFFAGKGSGHLSAEGVTASRQASRSRIFWNFQVSGAGKAVIKFEPVAGTFGGIGGGFENCFIDAYNTAGSAISILSWRSGVAKNCMFFGAVSENLFMGCTAAALGGHPYDSQYWVFENSVFSQSNQGGNTGHSARLTGGQGNGGQALGNTSLNTFLQCSFNTHAADAIVLEDTDTNHFVSCSAGSDTGVHNSVVLGSVDQNSSGGNGYSRYNIFLGGQYENILAHASQTGGASSHSNLFVHSRGNSTGVITCEAGAGGSSDGEAWSIDNNGDAFLRDIDVKSIGAFDMKTNGRAIGAVSDSTSSIAPFHRVVGRRGDANNSACFAGGFFTAKDRMDAPIREGMVLGAWAAGGTETPGDLDTLKTSASIVAVADSVWSAGNTPIRWEFRVGSVPRDMGAVNQSYGETVALTLKSDGTIQMPNLPTSNPGGSGKLWNNNGALKIT